MADAPFEFLSGRAALLRRPISADRQVSPTISVAVVFRFIRTFDRHVEVFGLRLAQLGQHHADFFQVQTRDFFVQLFGEAIDALLVFVFVRPEVNLREGLVGEGVGHDERRMAGGATEIHEAAFGEHVDALLAAGQPVTVVLRLDVLDAQAFDFLQRIHLDLVVEVADVADDGLVFHREHVLHGDDVAVAGGGDVDVAHAEGAFHGVDLKAFHGRLQRIDRIDLGDDDAGAISAERMGRAFADIAVTADDGDFAGEHDVGGALDAVRERFAAAVEVVELGLGD